MRSLINENSDPFVTTKDITGQFGSKYKGEHKVWIMNLPLTETVCMPSTGTMQDC